MNQLYPRYAGILCVPLILSVLLSIERPLQGREKEPYYEEEKRERISFVHEFNNLAKEYLNTKEYDKALKAAKTVLNINEYEPIGNLHAARASENLKNYKDAVNYYQRAYLVDPTKNTALLLHIAERKAEGKVPETKLEPLLQIKLEEIDLEPLLQVEIAEAKESHRLAN